MNIAKYSSTTATHIFDIVRISSEFKNDIEQKLQDLIDCNSGSFRLHDYNCAVYSITYETTETWEGSEEFADELCNSINLMLAEYAESQGGIEKIKI